MWNYAQLSETDFGKSLLIKQVTSVEVDTNRGESLTSQSLHLHTFPSRFIPWQLRKQDVWQQVMRWTCHKWQWWTVFFFFFQLGFQTTRAILLKKKKTCTAFGVRAADDAREQKRRQPSGQEEEVLPSQGQHQLPPGPKLGPQLAVGGGDSQGRPAAHCAVFSKISAKYS